MFFLMARVSPIRLLFEKFWINLVINFLQAMFKSIDFLFFFLFVFQKRTSFWPYLLYNY